MTPPSPMQQGTITYWREQLTRGSISPTELVEELTHAIEAKNPLLNAYLSWDKEAALREAAEADLSLPLGGIPIAIKDNICIQGAPTRCASRMLENFVAPYDATVISRIREAGAIPFGRTNMDEFAMGSTGENSAFGATKNPADTTRVPGGSSSGSAAAVASQTALAALGSDTGGSIRQPASHCGIVGMKPTYGRVSRYGLVAFASSLDQIGPLTTCVSDAALILNTICGHDPKDSTSIPRDKEDFSRLIGQDIKGLRFGLPKEYLSSGNTPEVTAALDKTIRALTEAGAEVTEISIPHADAVVSTYYVIACAEASSNLARFDGIRYGYRAESPQGLDDLYSRTRAGGFGEEVKRRIILGTYVLSSGFYDAYYSKAQKVRALVARDFREAFKEVDFILGPVAPTAAPKLNDESLTPLQVYLSDIYTIPANLAGLPGISLPCPREKNQLPVGIQLLAPHFAEASLLRAAAALEAAFA